MKILLVLLLYMLAAQQWSEASRKILMERMEAEGNGALFSVPKKMLLEAVDEGNGMETEFMFPDESDDEKPEIIIEEEKKRSKQQEDLVMEAIEEQSSEEKKQKKHQEDESSLSEIGDGDLLLDESKEEKWVGDKPKKKKEKYNTKEASTENDSSGLSTGETLQEEGEKKVEAKKEKAVIDEKDSGQPTEDNTPANADKGEVVEGFSGEVSLAETAVETGVGDFLSETAEEQDGSTIIKEEMQDDDAKAKKKTKKVEVKGTLKAEKLEKEGSKSKTLDEKSSKAKEEEVDEAVIEKKRKKGGQFEGSKSNSSDDKDLTGEAMAEEITDEETPADLIEREMQGGVEDLVTSVSKARKGEGEKQQRKDDAHGVKYVNANESEGGEDKEKPLKKLKTAKQPKLESLQEVDFELKGSDANGKKMKTKVKKQKDSQSELEKRSDVTSVKTSDLQSQVDMEDTAKSQMKKKKKVKSEKLKKEEKSYVKDEKNFDVFEEGEEFFGKANEKSPKKSTKKGKSPQKKEEKSSKKIEKKEKQSTDGKTKEGYNKFADDNGGEDTQELKILEVVDRKNAEAERDISKEKGDPDDEHSKRSEEELPTIEKQEEKLEIEVQGIAKEAQEKAEGSNSVSKSVASEGVDEEDDEYSDFMQDFSDLSTKFQDTALKVADHLGPNIQKFTDTSKTYFNKANQQITESFSPLVGKQFAPFFASLLSYGLLLVPLAVVIILFEHIRAMLSLQKVLLFVNIYLAAYFATLLLATFIMGEPMNFFYRSSASGYVHLQLLQALGYIIYLLLQTIDLVSSCSSEACSVKVTVVLQWFVAVTIGFHYYVTIFHRAMALKGPHTNWKIYGIYSCAFLVLCLFARIKRVKKGYVQAGQADTDKKH